MTCMARWSEAIAIADIIAAVEHHPPLSALRRVTLDATALQAAEAAFLRAAGPR